MNDICQRVAGAYCRPGMRGCVIAGKVTFQDGRIPYPEWPPGAAPGEQGAPEETAPAAGAGGRGDR